MKLLKTVNFFIVLVKIKLFKMNTKALNKNIGFVRGRNVLAMCLSWKEKVFRILYCLATYFLDEPLLEAF